MAWKALPKVLLSRAPDTLKHASDVFSTSPNGKRLQQSRSWVEPQLEMFCMAPGEGLRGVRKLFFPFQVPSCLRECSGLCV